ncbi:MAG: hypothetical protein ABWZ98_07875 [Nakamurella sp.]
MTDRTGRPHFFPVTPVIVLLIVLISWFPAGLVLLPMVVVGLAMATMAGQGGRSGRGVHWEQRPRPASPTWSPPSVRQHAPAPATPSPAPRMAKSSEPVADDEWPDRNPAVRSPFDRLAFWDEETVSDHQPRSTPLARPAWDPLGVAPLDWDFPDAAPVIPPRHRGRAIGAAKLLPPAVLLVALVVTAGDIADWWPLGWAAAVAGAGVVLASAVIALALSVMSSGRRSRR